MSAEDAPLPPDINRGPEILAICGSLVGLALVTVLLRVYVRVAMVKHMGADDWTIVAAMTVMFAEMMVIIPQVQLGAGRHYQYIKPESNITKGLHLNFVTQPLCLIGLCLTKISVGLFLLRITPSKRFRYFIWGLMVFTVLSATGNFLTVFFQCRPLAFVWDFSVPGGKCIPASHLKFAAFFNSSVAVVTDFIFALLPIPMLWRVQLNWKVKTALAGVLSLGIFASVAAIIKITFLSAYGKYGDFLFDSTDLTIWTTVEICTAIIAASIPCFKPLFKRILAGSSARYGSNKYGSNKYNHDGYARQPRSQKSTHTRGTMNRGDDPADDMEMYGQNPRADASIATGYHSKGSSKESIVQHGSYAPDRIMKVTQVTVSVDDQPAGDPKSMI
ncbi:integral membrane protein [Sarocladium strictum]